MSTFSAKPAAPTRHVAFLIFDGVKLLDVTGPLQVFADANEILGWPAYSTTLASALYLLLLRYLARQYKAVIQLVDTVSSDTVPPTAPRANPASAARSLWWP